MHTMIIAPTGTDPAKFPSWEAEQAVRAWAPGIVAQTLLWAAEELRQEASAAHLEHSPGTHYYTRAGAILQTAAEAIAHEGRLP